MRETTAALRLRSALKVSEAKTCNHCLSGKNDHTALDKRTQSPGTRTRHHMNVVHVLFSPASGSSDLMIMFRSQEK